MEKSTPIETFIANGVILTLVEVSNISSMDSNKKNEVGYRVCPSHPMYQGDLNNLFLFKLNHNKKNHKLWEIIKKLIVKNKNITEIQKIIDYLISKIKSNE